MSSSPPRLPLQLRSPNSNHPLLRTHRAAGPDRRLFLSPGSATTGRCCGAPALHPRPPLPARGEDSSEGRTGLDSTPRGFAAWAARRRSTRWTAVRPERDRLGRTGWVFPRRDAAEKLVSLRVESGSCFRQGCSARDAPYGIPLSREPLPTRLRAVEARCSAFVARLEQGPGHLLIPVRTFPSDRALEHERASREATRDSREDPE